MKKLFALLLGLTLVLTLAACPDDDPEITDPDDPDFTDPAARDTLYVGTPEFSGEFISWGTASSYDIAIRDLIVGGGVVATDQAGQFLVNENIVENVAEVEEIMAAESEADLDDAQYASDVFDADGNKTYTWEIRDDMLFSDGEPITAHDYAFGIKMQAAYSIGQAGHTSRTGGDDLVGFDAFFDGETTDFEGIEVIDDYTFTLTIDADNLPYFYELAMVAASPQPMHIYTNNGEYDFLTADEHDELGDDDMHIGEWIAQFISEPPVSSGPYVMDHYRRDQFVRLKLNENYVGDFRGHKAEIETVVVRIVPSATDIEHLLKEEIHVLTGLVEGDKINRGLDADNLQGHYFDRIGFGGLFFHTDFGPMLDHNVRQALAHLVDREQFVETFLEGYGTLIDAPFGIGQWMYQQSDRIPDELISFSPDTQEAYDLLDDAGWGYDEDDDPWEEGAGYRYNADGDRLRLGWLGTESEFSDVLAVYMNDAFSEAGIDFSARQASFDVLLDNYYFAYELEEEDRDYHMFNLATGYTPLYDPYYTYHSDGLGTTRNTNQFADKADEPMADFSEQVGHGFSWDPTVDDGMTVDELTEAMRNLPAAEDEQFLEYWEALMLRLNRLLPVLPLYSNQYYQFAVNDLENFELTGFWDWQHAIVDFRFAD